MQTGKLQIMKAMKLYRINIKNLEDPLENPGLLEMVGVERRKKVLRYYRTDDRKRSLGAGIIIRTILNENGLSENNIKYTENEKPVADNCYFNISHAGDYVVGVSSDCEVGCDIEKIVDAPLEIADCFFNSPEAEYIAASQDKNRAFFKLWTLKESYMKMTGRGMSIPLDSFEVVPAGNGFILGKSLENPCIFQTMEFEGYMFSIAVSSSGEMDFDLAQTESQDLM